MATEITDQGVKYLYTPFIKVDEEKRTVTGPASGFEEDLDGEGIDPEWLKQEFQDWFDNWANIREMHQANKGVGTAVDLDWDDQGRPILTSQIVDDDVWNKVKSGVYKGYSIGIKNTKKVADERYRKGRINGGKIIETSVVDRPCYDGATFTHVKHVLAEKREDGSWQLGNGEEVNKVADNQTRSQSDSDEARKDRVRQAIRNTGRDSWIVHTFPDAVIVEDWNDGCFYLIPYEDDGDNVTLGDREQVEQQFAPVAQKGAVADVVKAVTAGQHLASLIAEVGKAVWTTKYIDELPDSSFAYVDKDGRHLPYKDKDGNIDKPHLRNALARLDQTDIPEDAKDKAREKLEAAAKEVGIDVEEDKTKSAVKDDDKHDENCDCEDCKKAKADKEKSALVDAKKSAWRSLMALGTDKKKAASMIDAADMTVLSDISSLAERMALQTDEDHDGDIDFEANLEPQVDHDGLKQTGHVDEQALEDRIMGKAAQLIEDKVNAVVQKFVEADNGKASTLDADTVKRFDDLSSLAEDLKSRVETMENTVVQNTVKTVAIERHVGMGEQSSNQPQSWQEAMKTLTEKASRLDDTAQRDIATEYLKNMYGAVPAR